MEIDGKLLLDAILKLQEDFKTEMLECKSEIVRAEQRLDRERTRLQQLQGALFAIESVLNSKIEKPQPKEEG